MFSASKYRVWLCHPGCHFGGGGDSGGGGTYYANAERLYGSQADTADFMLGIGKENLPGAVNTYRQEAGKYADPQYMERQAGEAGLVAQQAIDQGTQDLTRSMASYGINPASGRWSSMMNENAIRGAGIKAGAINQARRGVEDKRYGAAKDYYSSLVGMPSDAAAQAGQAASGFANLGNAKQNQEANDQAAYGNLAALGYGALTMNRGGYVGKKELRMANGGGVGIGTDPIQRGLRGYVIGKKPAHISPREEAEWERKMQTDAKDIAFDPAGLRYLFNDGGEVPRMANGGLFGVGRQPVLVPQTQSRPQRQTQVSTRGIRTAADAARGGLGDRMAMQGGRIAENLGNWTGNTELAAHGLGRQAVAGGQDVTGAIHAYKGAGMPEVAQGLASGAGDAGAVALGTSAEQGAMLAAQNAGMQGATAATAEALGGAAAAEGAAAAGTAAAGGAATGALAAASTAMPWLAAGYAVGSMLGLFNDGGDVKRDNMLAGGDVDGPKGKDKVPAWLTDGEYVVNREAVALPGVRKELGKINAAGLAKRGVK